MPRMLTLSLIALALGACQAQPPVASQQLSPAQVVAIAQRQAL